MVDSSGKIPPSLLKGNINQLGDFDQCLSVEGFLQNTDFGDRIGKEIYGKYCLASIEFTLPPMLEDINRLMHSHYLIRSKLTDVRIYR